jgi:biopolymer transport protein ExbD
MGLKKRNKINAEFSMSSLTDIIFLLLIFFMLTSSLVQINMDLPESDSKTVAPADLSVMVTKQGVITFNGKKSNMSMLSGQISSVLRTMENRKNATVTIIAEKNVPWKKTTEIMKIANALNCRAIIATQPTG